MVRQILNRSLKATEIQILAFLDCLELVGVLKQPPTDGGLRKLKTLSENGTQLKKVLFRTHEYEYRY